MCTDQLIIVKKNHSQLDFFKVCEKENERMLQVS